jgi:hypothetical protein
MNDEHGSTEILSILSKNNGFTPLPVLCGSATIAAPIYSSSFSSVGSFLRKQNLSFYVIGYTVIFFCCMVFMEIVLEALLHRFPNLVSMATSVTLFQLGCCVLFPLVLSRGAALQRFRVEQMT